MSQVYSFRFTRFSTPFLSLCPSLHSIMRRHLQQRMGAFDKTGSYSRQTRSSDAASGWAGWALARQEFGSSVNPIITRGADFAHHITAFPPGFENLAASLQSCDLSILFIKKMCILPRFLKRDQAGCNCFLENT